jgi:tetratricopeptide (TPR) repeat protein
LIRDEIMVQKFMMKLREEVKVTSDDLRELRASHILVSTESEAKAVVQQLQQGGDFAALAKKVSQDPGSAAKGGDLGYFTAGSMVPAFEQAAFRLKAGETSGIVKTQFGYHIIKLADSRLRKLPKGEQDIEKAVLKEKQEKSFRQWYMTVKSAAKIEILSPELKGHDLRFKGRAAEALAEYKKAAQAEPTNPYLHVYMGDIYLALGQKGLAIAEYENAIKVQGGDPGLYLILGSAYQKMGEVKMAAEQYRKASLVASDNKEMHQRLLKIFEGMKRPAEVAMEKKEIQRIEKKERFEKELTGGK